MTEKGAMTQAAVDEIRSRLKVRKFKIIRGIISGILRGKVANLTISR